MAKVEVLSCHSVKGDTDLKLVRERDGNNLNPPACLQVLEPVDPDKNRRLETVTHRQAETALQAYLWTI